MQDTGIILRDIHDLDAIPWWPLAAGWWWVIGLLLLLLLLAGVRYWIRYSGIMPGWRGDARRQLRALKKALRKDEPRDVAGQLSILLRRIAMARSGRQHTAGLSGESWLVWLEENDSNGFKWSQGSGVLLQAPYMPPDKVVQRGEVMRLVVAAMRWVDTAQKTDRRQLRHWLERLYPPRLRKSGRVADV